MDFEQPEIRKGKYETGELSDSEKDRLLTDAETNLAELERDIAALEARIDSLDEEESELLEVLQAQAIGLREFIALGREEDSRGRVRDIDTDASRN